MVVTPSNFPLGECLYSSLSDYSWKDVSCNMLEWTVHIPCLKSNTHEHESPWPLPVLTICPVDRNPTVYCTIASLHALAWWTALQLIAKALFRFKTWKGLYFWALIGVSFGIILETLAFDLRIFYEPVTRNGIILYATLNWTSTVIVRTGFGLVLYSRLHIITQNRLLLRSLFGLIIIMAVLGHTGLLVYSAFGYAQRFDLLQRLYNIWIYFEVIFVVQDLTLSSCYIFYFWKYLNDVPDRAKEQMKTGTRTTFILLVVAYTWVALADVSQYTLLCTKLYLARMMCLPILEAIKLQLEFFVLNRLIEVGKMRQQLLGRQSVGSSLFDADTSGGTARSTERRLGRPLVRGSTSEMSNAMTLAEMSSKDLEKKV